MYPQKITECFKYASVNVETVKFKVNRQTDNNALLTNITVPILLTINFDLLFFLSN